MTKTATTFKDQLTEAHARGDERELDILLDMQSSIRREVCERIEAANNAAANLAHQLHALGILIDAAKDQEMDISDGDAPTLKVDVATVAIQDWMDR